MLFDAQDRGLWKRALPQGLSGHHALFEPGMIRFTMQRTEGPRLDSEGAAQLRALLISLAEDQDVNAQRDRVSGSPLAVQETLIRAYFETLFAYLDKAPRLAN